MPWEFDQEHAKWLIDGDEMSQWNRERPTGMAPKFEDEESVWSERRGTYVWSGLIAPQPAIKRKKQSSKRVRWTDANNRLIVRHLVANSDDLDGAGALVKASGEAVRLQWSRLTKEQKDKYMSSSFESDTDDEQNEDDDDEEESNGEDEDDNDSDYVALQQPLLVPAKATCTCLRALDHLHARPNLTAVVVK